MDGTIFVRAAGLVMDTMKWVNYGQKEGSWDVYHLPRTERAFLSGQICWHFGLGGPSSSVDTVCSGSMTALNDACRALATKVVLLLPVVFILSHRFRDPFLFIQSSVQGFMSVQVI
jgi:hypothetical protein